MKKVGIIWHQTDLRIDWNPAVAEAARECDQILPVFIYDEKLEQLGEASKWWLYHSLKALYSEYKDRGASLVVKKGDSLSELKSLIKICGAEILFWNARFEPKPYQVQKKVVKELGIETQVYNGNHLIDPEEIEVSPGKPYSVFTPFYKACLKTLEIPKEPKVPKKFSGCKAPSSDKLEIVPKKDWIHKLEKYWHPGRKGGLACLKDFVKNHLSSYAKDRDFPAIEGTSSLSPYLHFGELCPHEIWIAAKNNEPYRRQLMWREFGTYFLFHYPKANTHNWNKKFDNFSWDSKPSAFKKWTKGQTGYPIVDAGMRQLWETGWMHNRLRMIVASFLTKDLFINWTKGEEWFWDTLVDADKGNNILGWQWTAGSGPDAAPYFRIFNPVLQAQKFDPKGEFIRIYVPELKNLPDKWIHHPWDAPEEILEEAGIQLGKTYPKPIVDHYEAREEALKRFEKIK